MHLPEQARLYMGPLEEDIIANDVTKQFCQFGTIQLVQRIRYLLLLSVLDGFKIVVYFEEKDF